MVLDHERLDVYRVALSSLVFANGTIEALPRGRSHVADQFTGASTSILLNLAEGAGKLSKPDKRRYYLSARGSARESAATFGRHECGLEIDLDELVDASSSETCRRW